MRVAIPTCRDRVSPVFDVAQHLLLVELNDGAEVARQDVWLPEAEPTRRASRLAELRVQALICCAISQPLKAAVTGHGVEVLDEVCGNVEDIVTAYRNGTLDEERFAMPGCDGQRRARSESLAPAAQTV